MVKQFQLSATTDERKLHWSGASARGATNWLKALPSSSATRIPNELNGVGLMIHFDIPLHCHKDMTLNPFTDSFCSACGMRQEFSHTTSTCCLVMHSSLTVRTLTILTYQILMLMLLPIDHIH
jgi:hypothetical protein